MTTVQVEFWHLVGFFAGQIVLFVSAMWALAKVVIRQFEARLNERFEAQEKAREQAQSHWDERFARIESDSRASERALLQLKADLPVQYVRREDYVRNQTVIEAKLDAVALRLENLQLKGARND